MNRDPELIILMVHQKFMGINPGFRSSKTAFTVVEYIDNNMIHVIYSKQFENSSIEKMVNHAYNLISSVTTG